MFAAIDKLLKGTERNQIPMFALTITKPFRLTDATYKSNYQMKILNLILQYKLDIFNVYMTLYYCRRSITRVRSFK